MIRIQGASLGKTREAHPLRAVHMLKSLKHDLHRGENIIVKWLVLMRKYNMKNLKCCKNITF